MTVKKGRFDWYDLMTSDVGAAKAFYSKAIGWKTSKWEQGDYEMWNVGERGIGGIMPLSADAKQEGAPPHWMAYLETDDADATVKRAQALGGQLRFGPEDIPSVGRFAVLADPQGAVFAVLHPLDSMPDVPQEPGFIGWHELNTTDYQAAWKFYSELFGWKHTSSMDMGPEFGAYWMFGLDTANAMGGMSNTAKMTKQPPHWLYYVTVNDIDATVATIQKNGGQVLNGPMDVPGGGKVAQCMDPQGGAFAIFMMGKK